MPEIVPEGEEPVKRTAPMHPLPLVEDESSFDSYKRSGDSLPTATQDVLSATWDTAMESTAMGVFGDKSAMGIIDEMGGQKTLSVVELNQKYMGLGITWTEPKKEAVADYIAEAHQKRQILQNRMSLGEGGFVEGALGFGATAATHLLDPVEFGLNWLGGAAIRSASMAPAFLRGSSLASTLARGSAEGVLTGVPMEALEVSRNREMEMDVSLAQSMENIAMQAAFGAGMEGLGYAAREGFQYGKRHFGSAAKREWDFSVTESAAAQMMDGRRPNIRPLQELFYRERDGQANMVDGGGDGPAPYDTGSPVSGTFYVGTTSRNADFGSLTHGEYKNSRTDFGNGAYGQDNVMRANGYAASSFNDSHGLIHEFNVKDAKLLAVDRPLVGSDLEAVKKAAEALREFPELKRLLDDVAGGAEVTARDVYEALNSAPDGAVDGFNAGLKAQGLDGVHFVDAAKDGSGGANGVMVFPESMDKVAGTKAIESDAGQVAGLKQSEVDDIISAHNKRENKLFQSKDEDVRLDELSERSLKEPDLEDDILEQYRKDALETIKEMDDEGLLDAEEKALLDEIQGKEKAKSVDGAPPAPPTIREKASFGEKIMKAMYACVGKG